ncbi:hypothetical protein PspLS_11795 [Pyricularia sp. CBS 133598]|nr:hypothetical protein PspLS_11795 [Pyricularia sp. CBS 133598]
MAAVTHTPMFNELVAKSIMTETGIEADDIIILDNSAKYDPDGVKTVTEDVLDEQEVLGAIFDTMANINRMALESPTLCSGPSGGASFHEALVAATDQIARLTTGKPIRYVELGPEPWKSSVILAQLLRPGSGVRLHQYIGLDINPESEHMMRSVLEPIIGPNRFTYWVQDFYHASVEDYPPLPGSDVDEEEIVTVVANLGFQEGNDLPSRIRNMLASLTRPGDLVLSEMQIYDELAEGDKADIIRSFYLHPEMRRFSALVGQKFDKSWRFHAMPRTPDVESPLSDVSSEEEAVLSSQGTALAPKYMYNLVPLNTEVGTVNVATTLVSVRIGGADKYVLTNSCLKYTGEQFVKAREAAGRFVVREIEETGDGSVVFQIASKV